MSTIIDKKNKHQNKGGSKQNKADSLTHHLSSTDAYKTWHSTKCSWMMINRGHGGDGTERGEEVGVGQ